MNTTDCLRKIMNNNALWFGVFTLQLLTLEYQYYNDFNSCLYFTHNTFRKLYLLQLVSTFNIKYRNIETFLLSVVLLYNIGISLTVNYPVNILVKFIPSVLAMKICKDLFQINNWSYIISYLNLSVCIPYWIFLFEIPKGKINVINFFNDIFIHSICCLYMPLKVYLNKGRHNVPFKHLYYSFFFTFLNLLPVVFYINNLLQLKSAKSSSDVAFIHRNSYKTHTIQQYFDIIYTILNDRYPSLIQDYRKIDVSNIQESDIYNEKINLIYRYSSDPSEKERSFIYFSCGNPIYNAIRIDHSNICAIFLKPAIYVVLFGPIWFGIPLWYLIK